MGCYDSGGARVRAGKEATEVRVRLTPETTLTFGFLYPCSLRIRASGQTGEEKVR